LRLALPHALVLAAGICGLSILAGCSSFPKNANNFDGSKPAMAPPKGKCHASASQAGDSYVVFGHRYHVLDSAIGYDERGIASWYGPNFHGKLTSSGIPYNMYAMTAASKVLPLCTWVKVSNLESGKSAIVQVTDRGPFVRNRIIDLSYSAAKALGVVHNGTALVEVQAIANPSDTVPKNITQVSKTYPAKHLHHRAKLYVQVAAFTQHANAEKMRARLILTQIGRIHISRKEVHHKTFYRVLIGPYRTVDKIDALTDKLDHIGFHDTDVVIK